MDAAHTLSLKKTVLFLAITLLAHAAYGQTPTLQVPANVGLSVGGGTANTTSSISGTEITFNAAITASSRPDGNNSIAWVTISSGAGPYTTPTTLTFQLGNVGSIQGLYTATVTLTPTAPGGVAAQTISLSYTSGGGGGGGGTINAAPQSVTLNTVTGGFVTTQVILSTASTTALTFTGTLTPQGSWLSADSNTFTVSAGNNVALNVHCNAAGLSNNAYAGTIVIAPNAGSSTTINVTCNVGTGGGGQLSATQNPINWAYNTGGFLPTSVAEGFTSSNGGTTYTATASSSNGWLLINNNQGGGNTTQTAGNLSLGMTVVPGSNLTLLTTGTYTGSILVTDNLNNQVTITVNLTVNNGTTAGLTLSPTSVTLTALAFGACCQSATVTVSSTMSGTLFITPTNNGWLTVSQNTSQITAGVATQFTIFANPTSLSAGTYNGSVTVQVQGSTTASGTIPVTFVVGGGGGTAVTGVAPASLSFAYQTGTSSSFISQQAITIAGVQGGSFSATATAGNSGNWLLLSTTGGAIPGSVTVLINPNGLSAGTYNGQVNITTPTGTQIVPVTLLVASTPAIFASPGSLSFNFQTGAGNPQAQTVFFGASDNSIPSTNPISITSTTPWLVLTPTSGSVSVGVNPAALTAGVYSGAITVTASSGSYSNSPMTVPVVLVVNGGGSGGTGSLIFTPTFLSFTSVNGVAPASQNLLVSASVATSFTATTSVQSGGTNWLSISQGSGVTNLNLTVTANPAGLAAGTYNGTITFNSNGNIQTVGVTLVVSSSTNSGNLSVSASALNFSAQAGGVNPAPQTVNVSSASGSAPVSFTVTTTGGSWLTSSVSNGFTVTTPLTLTVSINTAALGVGTYNGNITLQPVGGTTVNIPVTVTVAAAPTVSATPTTLTFTYRAGDPAPNTQTINVSGNGAALSFSATAQSSGWLSVTPTAATTTASGTTPVTVSINPSGLNAGTYNGTVTVAGTGSALGSTVTTVTLTVTAPLPTVTKLTNAASYATGSISPGEIVTLFGTAIGPDTPVGLALDASGKVSTTIGGVQVLVNGIAAPMIYASATQISAVIPYEVAGFVSANVLVKYLGLSSNGIVTPVTTTQPGIFTQNSSGSGPGAILNQNLSVNSPANPANRGDVVVVYMTGEGQTSPAGVTGKVTTANLPAPQVTPGPLLQPSVLINGQPANFTYAGEAPGFVSGVMQLNVQIPPPSILAATGNLSIVVSMGGNSSQSGVTVSVK